MHDLVSKTDVVSKYFHEDESFKDKIKIQPELIFAIQGTSVLIKDVEVTSPNEFFTTITDYKSNINESTITVPVILQYLFNDKFYMEGGPQFGYIIDRNEKIKQETLKLNAMANLLYIIAVILIIAWAIGFVGYNVGGLIHILLVIAVIAIIVRIIQGRRIL